MITIDSVQVGGGEGMCINKILRCGDRKLIRGSQTIIVRSSVVGIDTRGGSIPGLVVPFPMTDAQFQSNAGPIFR